MATGGAAAATTDVDGRVTCSVCLEFYRGRRPKLLPCFHTFCEPCLVQLTRPSQGNKQARVTCPTCRAIHPLPPGGASTLQANFYIEDSDDTATQPDDSAMPVTQQNDEPTDDLQVKVKEQVKVIEAVTSHLSEEKEIERQKRTMELTIHQRHEAGQRLLDESRHQCLRCVEEVAGQLTDKLQADLMFADSLLKPLQALAREGSSRAQSTDPGTDPPPALLTDAVLRHFRTMSTRSQQPSASLFSYQYADNTANLTASLRLFMGTVAPSGSGISPQLAGSGQGKMAGQGAGYDPGLGVTAADGQVLLNQQQQQQLRTLQTVMNQMQADNDQLRKELNAFRQSVSDHMAAVNRDLPAIRSDVDHLQTEQATLTTLVNSVHSEMGTFTTNIGSLQKDMTAATTNIGSLQKDMTAATTNIGSLQKDVTTATTNIGSLQKDVTTATTNIGSLQKDVTTATTNIGSFQKDVTAATTDIESLQKESSKSQQSQKKFNALITGMQSRMGQANTAVFFNAQSSKDLKVSGDTVVKLDQVVSSIGGGYDPTTGIFTAPQSGTYLFLATVRAGGMGTCIETPQKYAKFHIFADGRRVASSWSIGCTSCTAHAVVSLQAGHQGYMKNDILHRASFRGDGYTSFCGVLLHVTSQSVG